ncbi:centromere protein O-like isoform X1 [Pecten maximus]|uniref:centromere protein O-like isoform X1 n=1 Tax=Pecten maximus TaxID=6579 RepID=UPI0014587CB3|nr:centromere protein O-like isoform X1 [Pecten maximus]
MYALENLEQLQEKDETKERITFKDEAVKTVRKILQIKQQKDQLLQQEKELDVQIKEAELKKYLCQKRRNSKKYEEGLANQHRLQQMLDCYRLTGISLHSQDKNAIILCFDNNYKSKFYDSFFVELLKHDSDTFELKHHSLPNFMPVANLAVKYLKDDLSEFASKVSDYLYAYITRREEVVQVQGLLQEDKLQITTTDAVDFVQVSLGKLTSCVSIKVTLTYQDLLHVMPTRVTFHTCIDDDMELPENFRPGTSLEVEATLEDFPAVKGHEANH